MENYWGVEEVCDDVNEWGNACTCTACTCTAFTATTILNVYFDEEQVVPVVSLEIGAQKVVEIEHLSEVENLSESADPKVVELNENLEPQNEMKSKIGAAKSISLDVVQV